MSLINSRQIKQIARQCRFDLCGIAEAAGLPEAESRYRAWLAKGQQAEMGWMKKHADRRANASLLADGVRSVIMLGLNYYQPDAPELPLGHGRVARYARGRDYHKVMEKMMGEMITRIEDEIDREAVCQSPPKFLRWVDYGPLLEKAYAEKAGLGYIGKSGMLINRELGSWFFLSEIVTSLPLEPDRVWSGEHGRCGSCQRCIDACPGGAITEDRTIDARRCLSYLTIEHRGEIPNEFARAMGNRVFGCDICQEVCPHNEKRQKPTTCQALLPESGVGESLDCRKILAVEDEAEFLRLAAGTALTRPKLPGLHRNARIVLANIAEDADSK